MSRYVVVDFAGHGFQVDLSRALAKRGHEVTHTWCSTNLTPHGDLSSGGGVDVVPVESGRGTFEKYRLGARLRSEVVYGWRTARLVRGLRPDGVLTSNVPLVSLLLIAFAVRSRRARWVLWLQDVQTGLAISSLSGPARMAAIVLRWLERRLIRSADEVVVISDDFVDEVEAAGASRPTIIPNWAVLDDLPVLGPDNAWARAHGLVGGPPVWLYAGTLGRKHPPELVVAIAEQLAGRARLVVASEGAGADVLADEVARRGLDHVLLLPFQPHEVMAEMLASAEVLIAVLHESAGSFSVPSKILSYLCAGRMLFVAMPASNGATRLVTESGAGVAVTPDVEAVRSGVERVFQETSKTDYGSRARRHAEEHFDVGERAAEFDALLRG